jgi:hypothetical protein
MCLFTEEWLLSGHYHKCLIGGVLQSSVSDHRVLGHLPDHGPSPRLFSVASSRKSLGGFTLRLFKNDGGHCVLGDLQCCRHFFIWYPSPDLCLNTILSLSSMDNSFDFMTCFLLGHALPTVEHNIDRCVPFQMFNQLNLSQVDSQVVETSQTWSIGTGCTWAQFWVS